MCIGRRLILTRARCGDAPSRCYSHLKGLVCQHSQFTPMEQLSAAIGYGRTEIALLFSLVFQRPDNYKVTDNVRNAGRGEARGPHYVSVANHIAALADKSARERIATLLRFLHTDHGQKQRFRRCAGEHISVGNAFSFLRIARWRSSDSEQVHSTRGCCIHNIRSLVVPAP